MPRKSNFKKKWAVVTKCMDELWDFFPETDPELIEIFSKFSDKKPVRGARNMVFKFVYKNQRSFELEDYTQRSLDNLEKWVRDIKKIALQD